MEGEKGGKGEIKKGRGNKLETANEFFNFRIIRLFDFVVGHFICFGRIFTWAGHIGKAVAADVDGEFGVGTRADVDDG